MSNRRTFFATAASGLAWLLGVKAEKPAPPVESITLPRHPERDIAYIQYSTATQGEITRIYNLPMRALTLNEWRQP